MPTLDPSNKPDINNGGLNLLIPWVSSRLSIPAGDDQIHFITPPGIWRPVTLTLSSTSSISLQVTAASHQSLLGVDGHPSPLWVPMTIGGQVVSLLTPISAIKLTNASGDALTADVL